jgi:hypothetical protein
MSHSATSVLVRTDRATAEDPTCRPGGRPVSLARLDAGTARRSSDVATSPCSSTTVGTESRSDAGHRGRRRLLLRDGDLERTVGVFTEKTLQRWAIDVPGVVEFLNRYYVWVHFPATITFLVWVFAVRRHAYATIRSWFAAVTVAGLVIHVLFPLAPPRMTPGFVDTLDAFGPDIYTDDTSRSVANQFAAMPSLHFGWALIVAIGLGRLTRRGRRTWMAHPVITLLAIVVTGNHYWIDAAVAGVLVVAAVGWWPGGPWVTCNSVGLRHPAEPAAIATRRSAGA